ncbi:MAG: hypothetical protein QOI66_4917 [Myxococcales bacterium]|nr:hypothetical protein [Myxococcales bacterium]
MPRFTVSNPGLVTTYEIGDFVSREVYTIDVVGPRRILQTTQFAERGPERDQLGAQPPVPWDVEVPDGAQLFGATSGISPGLAHQFWVGWLAGPRLHLQALMQKAPVDITVAADESLIFPPVMDRAGTACLYSWRPTGAGAATALWRHVVSGQLNTAAVATTEALSEIPSRPVVSVAAAIPGEPSQHAVLGWVEATPAGTVLGLAIVMPDRLRVFRSDPIADTVPFANQRLGVWAAAPASLQRVRLTAVVASKTAPAAYRVATFSVAPAPAGASLSLANTDLPAGQLHAAAIDYLKNHVDPAFQQTFLLGDGTLWTGKVPHAQRQGVVLNDPLAVATTMNAYWGVRSGNGPLTFEPL